MQFEDWFNEIEHFGLRGERFYADLDAYKDGYVKAEDVVIWLKAAYQIGREHESTDWVQSHWDDGK